MHMFGTKIARRSRLYSGCVSERSRGQRTLAPNCPSPLWGDTHSSQLTVGGKNKLGAFRCHMEICPLLFLWLENALFKSLKEKHILGTLSGCFQTSHPLVWPPLVGLSCLCSENHCSCPHCHPSVFFDIFITLNNYCPKTLNVVMLVILLLSLTCQDLLGVGMIRVA